MVKIGKKLNFLVVFWILFYFLVFGFLVKNSSGYLDPDLGWHLKVGEEISRSGSLPHINVYNYTYSDRWVDHEWLINWLSFKIYSQFGYLAVTIFFSLVITFSFVLLNLFVRKFFKKSPEWLIASLQLFGLIACSPSFGIRMQEFSFLFLILEFWIIKKFNDQKNWRSLIWFLPLFYLWSNIHGSFLFGLGILFFFLLIKFLENLIIKSRFGKYFEANESLSFLNLRIFAIFSFLSFFVTLVTPYGLELYSFLGGYSNTFYLRAIQEWLPQFSFPLLYFQLSYLILIFLILGPYLYNVFILKNIKINFWDLCLLIVFIFLGIKSRRNFPLMFIATLPFLLKTIYSLFFNNNLKSFSLKKELKYFLIGCLSLSIISQYASLDYIYDPFNSYCSKYPCGAIKFLKTENQYQNLNILNEYNWGGYLIWTYPEKKLFIDGRLPQTNYAGHTFLEEYYEFFKKDTDHEAKLKQYNIGLVLIKTKDDKIVFKNWEKFIFKINENDFIFTNYLREYLETSADWQKVYSDSLASVYLRVK